MLIKTDTFESAALLLDGVSSGIEADGILSLWERCYGHMPELKAKCLADYQGNIGEGESFETVIAPLIIKACSNGGLDSLREAHEHYVNGLTLIEKPFAEMFGIEDDIICCFYIGLGNGAGWATELNGKKAVLLGGEKLVELKWHTEDKLRGLMFHELCHVAHEIIRGENLDETEDAMQCNKAKGVWRLYIEGFAQHFGQVLNYGKVFEQHGLEWLEWCTDNHGKICTEYLRRLSAGEDTGDFFGDWNRYEGRADVGYYLGYKFTEHLNKEKSMEAKRIARLSMDVIEEELHSYLFSHSK